MGVLLTVREEVRKMIECENCEGSGLVEEECPECEQMIVVKCPDCEGSGKVKEVEEAGEKGIDLIDCLEW